MDTLSLEGPWLPTGRGSKVRVVLLTFMGERHSCEASLERSDDEIVVLRAVAGKELQTVPIPLAQPQQLAD